MSDVIELLLTQQAEQTKLADRLAAELDGRPTLDDYAARERELLADLDRVREQARARAAQEHAVTVARNTATWLGGQVIAARERREPADAAEAVSAAALMRDYPPPSPSPAVATGGHLRVPDRVVATHGPNVTAPHDQTTKTKGRHR